MVTGTVNPMMRERLKRIYEQMPEPRKVIAIGACALGGGVMKGCYNVGHGVDTVIPVDMFIPGCPPRPEAILFGVLKLVTEKEEESTMKRIVTETASSVSQPDQNEEKEEGEEQASSD